MKLNTSKYILGLLLVLPFISAVEAGQSCSALQAAYNQTLNDIQSAIVESDLNVAAKVSDWKYPGAADYNFKHLGNAQTLLQDLSIAVEHAELGYYPGYAYQIHNAIEKIEFQMWRANHWAAISFIYDKNDHANGAMNGGLTTSSAISAFHTTTLKCYVGD